MPSKPRTRGMYNQLDLTLYPYLPSPYFYSLMSKLFGQCPSTVQTFFNSLDTLHAYSPNGLTLLCPKCPRILSTPILYIYVYVSPIITTTRIYYSDIMDSLDRQASNRWYDWSEACPNFLKFFGQCPNFLGQLVKTYENRNRIAYKLVVVS